MKECTCHCHNDHEGAGLSNPEVHCKCLPNCEHCNPGVFRKMTTQDKLYPDWLTLKVAGGKEPIPFPFNIGKMTLKDLDQKTVKDIKLQLADAGHNSFLLIEGKILPALNLTVIENPGELGKVLIELPMHIIEILPKGKE